MARPELTCILSAEEFDSWYWLKAELVVFCRTNNLSPSGSKLELKARIVSYLGHVLGTPEMSRPRRTGKMPSQFTMEMVIGEGWRCGPALGAFFRKTLGNGFRFHAGMRDFIHHESGATLADAVTFYRKSAAMDAPKRAIAEQLEYNQHFRDYFRDNPDGTRKEAIAAWWKRRSEPNPRS